MLPSPVPQLTPVPQILAQLTLVLQIPVLQIPVLPSPVPQLIPVLQILVQLTLALVILAQRISCTEQDFRIAKKSTDFQWSLSNL